MSSPERPVLLGRAPLHGQPIEMYLRGTTVFALVSDHWGYGECASCTGGVRTFSGSNVAVIDVTDPRAARVRGQIEVAGAISDSRLVGDVLYVVSHRMRVYGAPEDDSLGETGNATVVTSLDVSQPTGPRQVGRLVLPRQGWEDHVHITDKQLFLASTGYGSLVDGTCVPPMTTATSGGSAADPAPPGTTRPSPGVPGVPTVPCTRLQAIDVAAAGGEIKAGAFVDVPGRVADRWSMDWWQGVLRVVVSNTAPGEVAPVVRTFRSPAPAELVALGQVKIPLPRPEVVTATRFDGARAFVVTFERIDPLWTVDLADPAAPKVLGHLEIPGWVDHLEPRGNLLVALGHDSPTGRAPFSMHVSLFDVSDMANPRQVVRQTFGDGMSTIPGRRDDWGKVFRVLDDRKLVLAPYRSYPQNPKTMYEAVERAYVQLLDLDLANATLAKRGAVEHDGNIERAVPLGEHVLAVSNQQVQVIDLRDRDQPKVTGALELSRNVNDVAVAGEQLLAVVGGDRGVNPALHVLSAADVDGAAQSRLELPGQVGRVFVNGGFAYVVGSVRTPVTKGSEGPVGWSESWQVAVYELGATPRARGSVKLPFSPRQGEYEGVAGDGATQVNGSTLVLALDRDFSCGQDGQDEDVRPPTRGGSSVGTAPPPDSVAPAPMPGAAPAAGGTSMATQPLVLAGSAPDLMTKCGGPADDFLVLDLANPDAPSLASRIRIEGAAGVAPAGVAGSTFFIDHYEQVPGVDRNNRVIVKAIRMFVTRVDLTKPAQPVLSGKINVPGVFMHARPQDETMFTVDSRVDAKTGQQSLVLSALYQPQGSSKAYLEGTLEIPGANAPPLFDDRAAYLIVRGELVTVDLRAPGNLRTASRVPIPGASTDPEGTGGVAVGGSSRDGTTVYYYGPAYARVRAVAGGHVFVTVSAGSNGGVLAYDIADPAAPKVEAFVRTQGGAGRVRVAPDGARAFVPAGPYGIEVLTLPVR